MSRKLLVIGSDSIHVYHFIELIKAYFDDVLLLTDKKHREFHVKTVAMDFSIGWRSIKTIKEISAIAQEFHPTTVHIHQANSYAFLTLFALKNFACQKILTAWGSDILVNPKQSMFLKLMVKFILNEVDIVTADSNVVLEEANKLVKKNLELHNINFGIDYTPCKDGKENIIYSNRLHKSLYNIDKIILSFAKFSQSYPDWKLVLAGNGEETDRLKSLVKSLSLSSSVAFVGWVDSKTNYEYYCKAKIYVSVPESDSVSLSLVEGIVCGCIPFVSNLKANQELIDENIGFVVEDLTDIPFQNYIEIDRKAFEVKRKEIEHVFSKVVNQEKYVKLYGKTDEH